jgi:hypothetical protein
MRRPGRAFFRRAVRARARGARERRARERGRHPRVASRPSVSRVIGVAASLGDARRARAVCVDDARASRASVGRRAVARAENAAPPAAGFREGQARRVATQRESLTMGFDGAGVSTKNARARAKRIAPQKRAR